MITIYRKNIIQALGELASYEFQKLAWFENDQGLCSAYDEDVEAVYDGTGLHEALRDGKIAFSKEADAVLRSLEKACDKIGYNRDERELIDAPEMEALRQLAAKALALVLAADGSESTVEIID